MGKGRKWGCARDVSLIRRNCRRTKNSRTTHWFLIRYRAKSGQNEGCGGFDAKRFLIRANCRKSKKWLPNSWSPVRNCARGPQQNSYVAFYDRRSLVKLNCRAPQIARCKHRFLVRLPCPDASACALARSCAIRFRMRVNCRTAKTWRHRPRFPFENLRQRLTYYFGRRDRSPFQCVRVEVAVWEAQTAS